MTSSHRPLRHCDAVVQRDAHDGHACPVGPIRLPTKGTQQFVDEFNLTYQSIGLTIDHTAGAGDAVLLMTSSEPNA